ncbi:glycosyltransferase family 2 protein [uncultured Roseibium sp.]|uniref:glycosyltransferase family 2 protein n=1 Tax=uncultured Roseibium sp. TaxID=1936171 RepID=UPI003216D674
MVLVMTLLVRDEEEILEANMCYHLDQGIDHIIVTDNLSSDRSREIIQSFVSQGVATYLFEDSDTHSQSRWVTRMARMACETFHADWVVHSDADEFWMPVGHQNLATFFSQCQEWNIIEARRHDFVCVQDETAGDLPRPFWERMTYRKTVSLNPLGNPLPPKVAHRPSEKAVVADGNHAVSGIEKPRKLKEGLEILHFPLRSRAQYTNKIRVGGRALMNNAELPLNVGATWRKQYEELQKTGSLSFLESSIVNSEDLKTLIFSGAVVEDTRLKSALRELSPGLTPTGI